MFNKPTLVAAAVAAALIVGGVAGAQVVSLPQPVIDNPPGEFTARWVNVDKSPANGDAVYQRVYCVTYSGGGVSCDWSDVRPMYTYQLSTGEKVARRGKP